MGYNYDEARLGANPAEFVVAVAGGYEEPALPPDTLCDDYMKSDDHSVRATTVRSEATKRYVYPYCSNATVAFSLQSFARLMPGLVEEDKALEASRAVTRNQTYPSSLGMQR